MRRSLLLVPLLITLSGPAVAQDKGKVRRDPAGIKGISPYNEHLAAGRKAFAAKDYDGALKAFDAAIAESSGKMIAYVLKAQTLLAQGNLDGAISEVDTGDSKQGNEEQNAKLLFLKADLKERKIAPPTKAGGKDSSLSETLQSGWDKVKEAWSAYAAFVASNTRAADYSASANDRKKKIDERVQREKDYGAVAARIRKNEEQAKKDAEADAAKNEKEK